MSEINRVQFNGDVKAGRKVKPVKSKAKGKAKRLTQSEKVRASAFFALASVGLAVSLPHLATEIGALTGAGALAAWLLAMTIDLGMVCCKAHLSASGHNASVAWTVLGACTGLSVLLNCHAFLAHATEGYGQGAAVIFGTFLPLFILALSYMGSEVLNRKGR